MYFNTAADTPPGACPYCSGGLIQVYHTGICPKIEATTMFLVFDSGVKLAKMLAERDRIDDLKPITYKPFVLKSKK